MYIKEGKSEIQYTIKNEHLKDRTAKKLKQYTSEDCN
jgi:hypothetical protein